MPLTRVIDLIGRNTHLDDFLPPLAATLQTVANFDVLGVVVPRDTWRTAQLKSSALTHGRHQNFSTSTAQAAPILKLANTRSKA